jgi:hypothetical protein
MILSPRLPQIHPYSPKKAERKDGVVHYATPSFSDLISTFRRQWLFDITKRRFWNLTPIGHLYQKNTSSMVIGRTNMATATAPAWKPQNERKQILSQPLTWREILTFISPAGKQQMVDFVRRTKAERGPNWLFEIASEFPRFGWLADLVCNYTAAEAFDELLAQYSTLPLESIKPQLYDLHALLRDELDRKVSLDYELVECSNMIVKKRSQSA